MKRMNTLLLCLALWLLVSVVLAFALAPRIARATEPKRVCQQPTRAVIAWLPGEDVGIPIEGDVLSRALYAMRGPHFGYKRGDYVGMDIPADWRIEAKFSILPGRQWVWFTSAPSKRESQNDGNE